MILNRIATAFRRQDWFVVLVEVLVVIFGVFIGLQVDDWNKARHDKVLEQQYLERLLADMDDSLSSLDHGLEFMSQNRAMFLEVIEIVEAGDLTDDNREAFENGLWRGTPVNPIPFNRTTLRELQSTGNLALISDLSLRQALGELDSMYEFRNSQLEFQYQGLRNANMVFDSFFQNILRGFDGNLSRTVKYDFEKIKNSEEFLIAANYKIAAFSDIIYFHEAFSERTRNFRDLLASKLNKTEEDDQ